jgi:hypothetical protein
MNHFPSWNSFKKTPFYGAHYDHDIGGFHNFPERRGWTVSDDYVCNPKPGQSPGEKRIGFNEFLQSWLFFGLLATVLDQTLPPETFLEGTDGQVQYINTTRLPEVVQDWKSREVGERNKASQARRMIRAQLALDKARNVVRKYCSYEEKEGVKVGITAFHRVDKYLALSLILLGETLANAKANIVREAGTIIRGWHGDANEGWGASEVIVEKMKEVGWCENTIYMLRGQFGDHSISLLSAFESHSSHHFVGHQGVCTWDRCHRRNIDDSKYKPGHHQTLCPIPSGGECPSFGPVLSDLLDKIQDRNTSFPVLQLKLEENGTPVITVKEYTTANQIEYATISHVWADGYGNPHANELPKCQLTFFDALLRKARDLHQPGNRRETEVSFWIDTLAIPVGTANKAKRDLAITKIHQIFFHATYTIVIDGELLKMQLNDSFEGTAMKILASGWMRRLWTLQEAYLSEKLYFTFEPDQLLNDQHLERRYARASDNLMSNAPIAAHRHFQGILGSERPARIAQPTQKKSLGLLVTVWKATQWRTTAHSQHETLALATILNVDAKNFAEASQKFPNGTSKSQREEFLERKMAELWDAFHRRFGSIPPGIIFLPGSRLTTKGYRWAPKSCMTGSIIDYPDPLSLRTRPAKLDPHHGLLVHYPGFFFHCKNRSQMLLKNAESFHFPSDNTMLDWYIVEKADLTESSYDFGNVPEVSEQRFAIILPRPRPGGIREISLLVQIEGEDKILDDKEEGEYCVVYYVSIIFRVWIRRETGDRIKISKDEYMQALELESGGDSLIYGEALDAEQKWYVDGKQSPKRPDTPPPIPTGGPSGSPAPRSAAPTGPVWAPMGFSIFPSNWIPRLLSRPS